MKKIPKQKQIFRRGPIQPTIRQFTRISCLKIILSPCSLFKPNVGTKIQQKSPFSTANDRT